MAKRKVIIKKKETLASNWHKLYKLTFDYRKDDGTVETQVRELYDRPNGATILLYNKHKKTVILTRQFRIPSYLNGNASGMLIETPAGLLDNDKPEEGIRRETEEETGYRVEKIQKIFEVYMSPGAVSELLYFYTAEYTDAMRVNNGGGLDAENENIEVLEFPFEKTLQMISTGEIKDAKTIMLLYYAKIHNLL